MKYSDKLNKSKELDIPLIATQEVFYLKEEMFEAHDALTCIGKKNYEIDNKFYKKFITQSKKNRIYFSPGRTNKKLFDLRKFVYEKLKRLNVKIDNLKYDTFQDKNNFFSYLINLQ